MPSFMIDEKKNLVESQGFLLDERKNLVKDQGYVIDEKKNLIEYQGGGEVDPPITEEVNMIKKTFSFSGVKNDDSSAVDCSSLIAFLKTLDFSKVISLNIKYTNGDGDVTNTEIHSATRFNFSPIILGDIDLTVFNIDFGMAVKYTDPIIYVLGYYQLSCLMNKITWVKQQYESHTDNGILSEDFDLIFYIAD